MKEKKRHSKNSKHHNIEKFRAPDMDYKERASEKQVKEYCGKIKYIKEEIGKVVIGQDSVVEGLIRGLLCNGHVLLEGVPGIAKTLLILTLGKVTGATAKRIQFTVDLLPTDIVGITTYTPEKGMEVIKGPIFANFLIADEINRSPPKCVLGETPILMENGEIKSIKEIIKEYGGREALRKGNEEWLKLKKPLKLMSLNLGDYKIKPEEVKYLYKQKTTNPYHNVMLKSGRRIKTSTEHPFFTLKNGRIEMSKASELKEGECVLVPRQLRIEGNNLLNYSEEATGESEEVKKEISRRKELYNKINDCRKKGMSINEIRKTIYINEKDEQLLITFINSRPNYLELENIDNYFFSKSKQFGQVSYVRKPIAVSKELARMMAIIISEGCFSGSYFYLTMKEQDVPIRFLQDLEEVFGIKARLLYDNKRNQYRVAFRSDALVKLLRAVGYETQRKAGDKEIPSFIMKSSDENVKEFLKAYYEGDGCVHRDCVKVTTKSRKIANSLSYLLLRMGFVARISRELSNTRIGNYYYKRKFYNLGLYGGDLTKFYEKVGFLTESKNEKLRALIKNVSGIKTDLMPGMHQLLRLIRKSLGLSHKQFYELTGMHAHNLETKRIYNSRGAQEPVVLDNPNNALMLSRSRLNRITGVLEQENETLTQLRKILGGDFYCDFIKKNEVIKPREDYYLYDFSMEENHSFIAGFGGIISHNTQSALLEAMQERNVTIGKQTYSLPNPFFVMATENPIETSGVYFLPEAQVDRFLFKIIMEYPKKDEEKIIMKRNMTLFKFEDFDVKAVLTPEEIIKMQEVVKKVYLSKEIEEYIVRIVAATRDPNATEYNQYVEMGCSPRASIGIFIASKAEALMKGRNFVIPSDVKKVVYDVMRHRLILTYLASSEKVTSETVIRALLDKVEIP
ncbi:AAA family ATPase [Candidatus Pacearchaeota archaeon]|nr:AAA family ATPase [Candidatus Pacearchaeota archaeon]